METHPALRPSVLERLREALPTVRTSRVVSCGLWVLAEYSSSEEEVLAALAVVREGLGPLPLLAVDGAGGCMLCEDCWC